MQKNFYRLLPGGDPESGMKPSNLTATSAFTTADKTETDQPFFKTDDESILCGVWECAPSREEIESYPVHEMMTAISGSVTLTDQDGRAETFTAGDTFLVAKGSRCTWHITETLRKFYMIAA